MTNSRRPAARRSAVGQLTQRNGWAWCAAAAVLFGAATPATKLVVGRLEAVTLAGLLYLGAAAAVAPIALTDRRARSTAGQRGRLMLAVGFGGGLAPVLLVLALARTPAGTVSLFLNLELVATAVIARVFLQEHLGRRGALGIAIVAAGGVLLAGSASTDGAGGAALVIAACGCWGIDNAITASLDSFTPSQITLTKGVVAGSVNLALGLALGGIPEARFVAAALVIGALGYGLSITMWITGARLLGAARGQAIFALAPFVGALLAWPVTGDRLTATVVGAAAVSLFGVVIVGAAHHGHAHTHAAVEHAHPISDADGHHRPGAMTGGSGPQHQHVEQLHDHPHLPDIHHRHRH